MSDTTKRSLAKTISWRITGSLATFGISYFVIGSLVISGTIAIIQMTFNTILYFVHERLWSRISWGQTQTLD